MSAACPTCGFDAASLSPPDAVVALRSLPRRFRAAATPRPDREPPDPDGARPAEAAAGTAAGAIAELVDQLRRVLVEDAPALPGPHPAPAPGDPGTALERLASAATGMADLAAAQPATAWTRTGRRGPVAVSAADLLREAVHAGIHQLRVASGGAPDEDED